MKNGKTKVDYDVYIYHAIAEVSQLISENKDEYYTKLAMKLNNPRSSSKTYWSILKTFYNDRKIPIIPQLKDGKHESDFKIFPRCFCFLFLLFSE